MNYQPITRPPNAFQQPVSEAAIIAIARQAFGSNHRLLSVQEFGTGLFNNSYHLQLLDGSEAVLRVAPAPAAPVCTHEKNLLRREQAIESQLHAAAPLFPRTLHVDFQRQIIDRDFVIQTYLPGTVWDEVQESLPAGDNEALWRDLAGITRAIHALPGVTFGFPGMADGSRFWSETVLQIMGMMWVNLQEMGLDRPLTETFQQAIVSGRHWLDEINEPRLLHGDIWPKNVLIDLDRSPPRIVGILDAERALWGDPWAEWVFHLFPIPDAFWEQYGRSPQTQTTRFRHNVYRGWYLVQVLLEAPRFDWDSSRFWTELEKTVADLQQLL